MKREIKNAYAALTPTEAERDAILRAVLARASESPPERTKAMKTKTLSRLLLIAAIVTLLLILGVAAYAQDWFGLDQLAEGRRTIEVGLLREEIAAREKELQEAVAAGEDPVKKLEEMDARDFPRPEKEFRIVSLQGFSDSPEAQACLAYEDFLEGYDTDKAILRSVGNQPTGFEEEYGPYTCYTQEMADKIDEICETYGLQKLSGFQIPSSLNSLYYLAGTGNFSPKQDIPTGQRLYPIAVWADGSFRADGSVRKGLFAEYQVSRCVKGSFNTWVTTLDDPEAWTAWSYTTENGAELLLAQNGERALIAADRPASFVTVGVHGNKKLANDPAALEAFAELFDFTAIP